MQERKRKLATVVHLCGACAGDAYARRGFRLTRGQPCRDHDVRAYLARVARMEKAFARLAGRDGSAPDAERESSLP